MDEYEQFFYETRSEGLWNHDNGTMKEWRVRIKNCAWHTGNGCMNFGA